MLSNRFPRSILAVIAALALQSVCAETVKDRVGAVLGDRAAMQSRSEWIYNDWRRGLSVAKENNKPLLVVLRCVPCLACAGIDASVLNEPDLRPLLSQFVLVRVMNANDLDLSLFQFDYDLSFSAVFFNGDGTVYGRYGSWLHQKNSQEKTTAGFRKSLERVLELHQNYPLNKSSLRGKQGGAMPVTDPLQLPEIAGKYKRELDWEGKVVQSCVHCHQIGDAVRAMHRAEKKEIPARWIYPMPAPETIGLMLAAEDAERIEAVTDGSIAAAAGLKAGDELVSVDNQPVVSVADVSWILHQAPENGSIRVRVRRGEQLKSVELKLSPGWRMGADISRRVGTWPMRAMATGGLLLKDLNEEERTKRNLGKEQMALFIEHAGEYGEHAAAKKAGFAKGDVIVKIGQSDKRVSESQLIGQLLHSARPGDRVPAVVLRNGMQLELMLPIQ